MTWSGIALTAFCIMACVPAAQGADGQDSAGKLIGSGDGYEIRLVPSGPVALVNAPPTIQNLLAPIDPSAKASSPLAPPTSATGGVFLVSDARTPTPVPETPAVTDTKQESPSSSNIVYLNRTPAVTFHTVGFVTVSSYGIVFPGTLVYANLATGERTSFLLDASNVLSAAADEHYLYVVKTVVANETQGTAFLPVTHTVLTAQPLSKNGDIHSVTVDQKASKSIRLPANFSLSIKDGVIVVGSLGHYTFDGKEFKVVR